MEVASQTATRRPELALRSPATHEANAPRTLTVSAVYRLSEAGRKASLLTGGDGREHQQRILTVPVTRLHLVHVDANGVARLKLRPRFELNGAQRVTRINAPPVYDTPPTIETLFQDAARNHELEATYHAQRTAAQATRQDADDQWRRDVTEAFLSDPTRRAIVHPSPTPRRCEIASARGRLRFDTKRDRGLARQVPPEAFRRFRADLLTRKARAQQAHAEQLTLQAEKQRLVADWVHVHGTDDQRARQAAGVLPLQEGVDAMTAEAFSALAHLPRYTRDGATRLQAFLRQFPSYAEAIVTPLDLVVSSRLLSGATSHQWALMQEIQRTVPDTRVVLRERTLTWARNPKAPKLRTVTVLVIKNVGPITLRRELIVPDGRSPVPDLEEERLMKTQTL